MKEMPDYEKLGVFYLGRLYDAAARKSTANLLLYKSKDLTTHAVCVGMTGSGKTGLCVDLLEEAAMDGIPALIIDPKGDMANLLLTFPQLRADDFLPWINEDDAHRKGQSPEEYAASQAELWATGLSTWGQDGDRIARLRATVDFNVYTPGSTAGLPISILKSLDAPSDALLDDPELLGDRVTTTVTSLLGLMGINADPIRSREHVLLSYLLTQAWQDRHGLDLSTLIHQIQEPPMERIGVMTVESFFPSKDRFQLALMLNSILAAPGFSQWLEGEPLDIGGMLYSASGKPRHSIISIAHLNEAQRMFFLSLFLNEVVGWVRSQPGTTSLRAILYMDEIFGFFPPVANPPSKKPLLTLLKQARAYGLGVVLTTQNPVDLDYKGLANTGTWFIGRLQTERDKARVIEGLEGASAEAGVQFNRSNTERTIAGLGNRIFLMNNVHDDETVVFETRWAMSYLRGPLTRAQIKLLTAHVAPPVVQAQPPRVPDATQTIPHPVSEAGTSTQPLLPPDIEQYFIPVRGSGPSGSPPAYAPALLSAAKVGFIDRKSGARMDRAVEWLINIPEGTSVIDWSTAHELSIPLADLERSPLSGAVFLPLPKTGGQSTSYIAWKRDLAAWLYRNQTIELYASPSLRLTSRPGETERDFQIRLVQTARERRDAETEKLRAKYDTKESSLRNQILRAEQTLERERQQVKQQKTQTAISVGATVLGAFLGRGLGSSVGRMTTAARGASRTTKETQDVGRAQESLDALKARLVHLEEDFKSDADRLAEESDAVKQSLERVELRPTKQNIEVALVALAWVPYWRSQQSGDLERAY